MTETMKMSPTESYSEKVERETKDSLGDLKNEVPKMTDKQLEEYQEREKHVKESFLLTLPYAWNSDKEVHEEAIKSIKQLFYNERGIIRYKGNIYDITTDLEQFIKDVGTVKEIQKLKITNYHVVPKLFDDGGAGGYVPKFTRLTIE